MEKLKEYCKKEFDAVLMGSRGYSKLPIICGEYSPTFSSYVICSDCLKNIRLKRENEN